MQLSGNKGLIVDYSLEDARALHLREKRLEKQKKALEDKKREQKLEKKKENADAAGKTKTAEGVIG
jgi:sRNA-binding protein